MPKAEPYDHRTIDSNNPKYRALAVDVEETQFQRIKGILPAEQTLYSSADWKNFFGQYYLPEFADFRFTAQIPNARGGGGTLLFKLDYSSPIIWKNHVPGVNIATVWAWVAAGVIRRLGTPAMDTALSAIPWVDKGASGSTFNAYLFKGFDAISEGGDSMRAIFVPPINATGDPNTPVRTFVSSEESFYWPSVLTEALDFTHSEYDGTNWASGGGANQFSKWGITPKLRHSYRGLTQVEINDYISDAPWDAATITDESLHPTRIYWDLVVDRQTLPECLTPGQFTTPTVYRGTNAGTNTSDILAHPVTFNATPQTDWIDHIFSDVVTFSDGLYFRRTKTAIVPPHLVDVS